MEGVRRIGWISENEFKYNRFPDWKTWLASLFNFRLSDCEKAVAEEWTVGEVLKVRDGYNAAIKAEKNFSGTTYEKDAIRHCVWSCEMTKTLGIEKAKIWGDAHECESQFGIGPDEKMDFHNNHKGRGYGEDPAVKSCESACKQNFDDLQKKP